MGRRGLARTLAIGGLSVVSAVLAHGGTAGFRSAAWLTGAVVGSLLVALALGVALGQAGQLRARVERIAAGDVRSCLADQDPDVGLWVLVSCALACQAGAHVGLTTAGVHATPTTIGAPTLHVVLAFLTAVAVWALDGVLAGSAAAVVGAIRVALALLLETPVTPQCTPLEAPKAHAAPRGMRGRAPPITA